MGDFVVSIKHKHKKVFFSSVIRLSVFMMTGRRLVSVPQIQACCHNATSMERRVP